MIIPRSIFTKLFRCGAVVVVAPVFAVVAVKNVVHGSVMKSVKSGSIGWLIVCMSRPPEATCTPSRLTQISASP